MGTKDNQLSSIARRRYIGSQRYLRNLVTTLLVWYNLAKATTRTLGGKLPKNWKAWNF